jgi:cytochrome c5
MSGEESDETLIKPPKPLTTLLAIGFAVPALIAALIAVLVMTEGRKLDQGPSSLDANAVAARIKPVANVAFAGSDGGAAKAAQTGEQIVQQYCAACHATGAAGAPKIGDKGSWAARIGSGLDQMLKVSISGKGAMPARGGAADLSNDDLARAIVHMANQSGGKLKAPAAPNSTALAAERSGEQVVQAACIRCHESGQGGAPRIGDKTAWSQRISQGVDAVTKSAIRGHGGMPARGGLADLTDREVTSAILYMFGRAGAQGTAKQAAGK